MTRSFQVSPWPISQKVADYFFVQVDFQTYPSFFEVSTKETPLHFELKERDLLNISHASEAGEKQDKTLTVVAVNKLMRTLMLFKQYRLTKYYLLNSLLLLISGERGPCFHTSSVVVADGCAVDNVRKSAPTGRSSSSETWKSQIS